MMFALILTVRPCALLGDEDKGEVVALATGSVCLASENASDDGRTLHDCHAIVIARRAFLK